MLNKSMFYVIACCSSGEFSPLFSLHVKLSPFYFLEKCQTTSGAHHLPIWTDFFVVISSVAVVVLFCCCSYAGPTKKRNLHKDCMQWNCKKAVTPVIIKGKHLFSPSNIAILKLSISHPSSVFAIECICLHWVFVSNKYLSETQQDSSSFNTSQQHEYLWNKHRSQLAHRQWLKWKGNDAEKINAASGNKLNEKR